MKKYLKNSESNEIINFLKKKKEQLVYCYINETRMDKYLSQYNKNIDLLLVLNVLLKDFREEIIFLNKNFNVNDSHFKGNNIFLCRDFFNKEKNTVFFQMSDEYLKILVTIKDNAQNERATLDDVEKLIEINQYLTTLNTIIGEKGFLLNISWTDRFLEIYNMTRITPDFIELILEDGVTGIFIRDFLLLRPITFSDNIKNLNKKLTKIYFQNIIFSKIPEFIFSCYELTELSINNIELLYEFDKNQEKYFIKENMKNFSIQEIPKEISKLKKLKLLEIKGVGIKKIPKELFECPLEEINFRVNEIDRISPQISNLKKITFLDYSNNNLFEIPDSIKSLSSLKFIKILSKPIKKTSSKDLIFFNNKNFSEIFKNVQVIKEEKKEKLTRDRVKIKNNNQSNMFSIFQFNIKHIYSAYDVKIIYDIDQKKYQ